MKTVFKSLLVAFALTTAYTVDAKTTAPSIDDVVVKKTEASYQVAIYPTANYDVLNVIVEKPATKVLQIRVVDNKGNELAAQSLNRKSGTYRVKFNLQQVTDGQYKVEVNDGQTTNTYPFTVSTKAPVVERTISLQ
ncbi:hypothetical protein BN8_00403 [Fibrisoma limi BUZ 3]|uniref:Secretion system C-terminal sorting domain-containing protein n=1 Tax=Fibrisoma limi BUZ 3 TaxID=1185876 RepID=I2GC52_9BACT|nr:hypothetical protein [Fibrisoma limi]CCH51476.1 hypothetical protein BN8_00403 [Fibrisoma limi BUZ 3]